MDVYLKVLNWSLDTSKAACAAGAAAQDLARFGYYALGALLLLLIFGGVRRRDRRADEATRHARLGTARSAFVLALIVGGAIAYGAAKLTRLPRSAVSAAAALREWHGSSPRRWNARMHDHRMVMVGAGFVTLLLSIALFGTLPMSFFPPQNSDFRGSTSPCRRAARSRRPKRWPTASRRSSASDPNVDRVFERINVGDGHVNIVLKKDRHAEEHRVRAQACRPRSPRCPTRRVSFQSQQGGGPGAGFARHHALPGRRRPGSS